MREQLYIVSGGYKENYPDIIKYRIKFLRGNTITVTKEFLDLGNVPDIVSIKISSEGCINQSNNLTQDQI